MNKVFLMGNLTRNPDINCANSASQIAVTRFTIAVQRKFQSRNQNNGTDVDFINCVAFGKTGENIGKFFTKGRRIAVFGRLQVSNWEDNNGQKRVSTDVIVEDFEFCDKKSDAEDNDKLATNNTPYRACENAENEELPF